MKTHYSLKHLNYFVTLAELKHFGKAAEACFVTQPTLSAAIKEFEEILGLQLFERTKRRVLLAPCAYDILKRAREILLEADALTEYAKSKQAPLSGELNVGVIPTIAPYLLPRFMNLVRQEFPELILHLKEDQTERLLKDLHEGQLDILILALPFHDEAISEYIFMQDPFYCALPKNHPLAKKRVIKNEDIYDENLLLLQEGHCLRDHALAACSWPANKTQRGLAATSLITIVQMVANGSGLTLLPHMAVEAGIAMGADIKTIPLSKDSAPRDIGLVWRKTSGRSEEFSTLGAFLKEKFS
jgi:LysR family hydrogen peroxide-inducible transcriptional activator